MGFFEKIFGTYSDRELKRIMPIVKQINSYEEEISSLSDKELKDKTPYFRELLKSGKTLDDILPEAFAVVREAAKRVLGMRHFDVQLIGGIVLHQGRIAEMKTGEGKTLVATLPCYLNALEGKGVHVITVNDYLAKRDSEQMGKIHRFLGLTVGLVTHETEDKSAQYMADITYGTNNEFGFDYLRDNMANFKEHQVQKKGHNFAIVDEVDSILIDEARTPLIISGAGEESTDLYKLADMFAKRLTFQRIKETDDKVLNEDAECDYIVDEKAKTATLTPQGVKKAEAAFSVENLSDPENMTLSHHINQAIKAIGVMKKDIDYVVKDGEVIIVDEFTGRLMIGRRYSEGLHQAIEAKEGVTVERESKTLATITFQNYFRLYSKLSGMTGTAETEEAEFQAIYKLDVVVIPTNKPMIRKDHNDSVYKTEKGKFDAVLKQIQMCIQKNQPVLVGTVTIENSEKLSSLLKKNGIKHNVLNAKFHEKEAEIIAQAGKPGAVTIATNMAGRGTDIMLGGNAEFLAKEAMKKQGFEDEMILEAVGFSDTDDEEILNARKIYKELYDQFKEEINSDREKVVQSGGLYIIGTERHESRRIDNQLRGRAGRQGDPGESRFFISFDDELMHLFGSDRIKGIIDALKMPEDEAIEHGMLTGAIENAQKNVEGRNFLSRKNVLEFDDVMNVQRGVIYSQRQNVLDGKDLKSSIEKMIGDFSEATVMSYTSPSTYPDDWNLNGLIEYCESVFLDEGELSFTRDDLEYMTQESLIDTIHSLAMEKYKQKEEEIGSERMREIERIILLRVVDDKWMDHIDNMDQLRRGIGLRAYGQKNPVQEYKDEGYQMYEEMIGNIGEDVIKLIFRVQLTSNIERKENSKNITMSHGDGEPQAKKPVTKDKKPGRNDLCPCGSGKKYKKCCGMDQ